MDDAIRDPESARRLARAIVSDIALYHKSEAERGIVEDSLFQILSGAIEEGRRHYASRVDPELLGDGLYEKALVDVLLRPFGRLRSRIW
ncbi:MAG: hypothetical protein SCH98_07535 [Deferrisomatales bacterium]|nr:hypothetical protein [Deferrisomatales bacterium]